jgi:hypothetical protein
MSDTANASCDACLITPGTAAAWGPIVQVGSGDAPFNIAGCFGLVLNEGASTTGCGAARWAFDRCLQSSCAIDTCCADPQNCTATEDQAYSDCRAAAFASGAPCESAANDLDAKCSALDNDAAAALLARDCPLDGNATLQQFTLGITGAFCGP